MPSIRVLVVWHMHQPFYKDLVTGEYRLPWVRLHALKDYYGMVKLLDEFPHVHQTFNLVPSLIAQLEDYLAGNARSQFLEVVTRPVAELSPEDRQFALRTLFFANPQNMIARYPRYQELWDKYHSGGADPTRALRLFTDRDLGDLQVLSQLAWFDEYFLAEPDVAALVKRGRDFSEQDKKFVLAKEHDILAAVLPAYADAAKRGAIEISTSPYYHPILPLVCDTNIGAVSSPGLPLPRRFQHPEDAEEQLRRGLDLHERVFGVRPKGAWPSEGSVSDEVLRIGHKVGLNWMASDEGVLGRTVDAHFRDAQNHLPAESAPKLFDIYRWQQGDAAMHMIFRDHAISDLIGFVYSGMPASDAAAHLINGIRGAAGPVLAAGRDAVVSVILDGENAWEYYPRSGREFLRYFYDRLQKEKDFEALTVSEAIARHKEPAPLTKIAPGSWINANYNVWIGAPEDNRAWDLLNDARHFYTEHAPQATEAQRKLAWEEVLIAEGSDWNWWYGPEHHSANDQDFDELYRRHLSNIYQALGVAPPDALAQPIARVPGRAYFVRQSAYIHPKLDRPTPGYFDWIGAATYAADRRASAMHGKQFYLGVIYAGIDEQNLYGRLEFFTLPQEDVVVRVPIEVWDAEGQSPKRRAELSAEMSGGGLVGWSFKPDKDGPAAEDANLDVRMSRSFQFALALRDLSTQLGDRIRLRFTLWRDELPIDALPGEGSLEVEIVPEPDLVAKSS